MKLLAFYLPQFHNIPENDEWWGDGFTEWTNVKAATPIYKGHKQPKIPLNNNYYDLTDDNVKIWQANIAKQYGIYGFCYYHYWFGGKLLLEKPMEQMLCNKNIDFPFCVCWANEPWTKIWVGEEKKVLLPQTYGDKKEWKEHFVYLLPFFKDSRYICIDGKPLISIYRPRIIPCIKQMMEYWNELAIEEGFKGIHATCIAADMYVEKGDIYDSFDNIIEWQPHAAKAVNKNLNKKGIIPTIKSFRRSLFDSIEKKTGIDVYRYSIGSKIRRADNRFQDYSDVWDKIIKMDPICEKSIPGAFVRWDNSPRHHERATIIRGETPELFEKYMEQQIIHARTTYKSDFIFIYAWNEWAEGGYLEPDEEYGYAYLESIKKALIATKEFPDMK